MRTQHTVKGILATLGSDEEAQAYLVATGNASLLAEVEAVRDYFDEDLSTYLVRAIKRFANLASPDDWRQMVTNLETASDLAAAWLECAVKWSIMEDRRVIQHSGKSGNGEDERGCLLRMRQGG